nr:unnamed protein product [Callosobruchus chinensis]
MLSVGTLLWSNNLSKQNKLRIYQSIVQSILLYESEIWETTKRDRQRLKATEIDFFRSCGVSRRKRGRPLEEWEKHVKKDILRRDMADHD